MTKTLLLAALCMLSVSDISADPGDTTIVQTFTFEEQLAQPGNYKSPGRRWFDFPADNETTYSKILMYHTLKCFDGGLTAGGLGFPCGEWDYLSYNYLFDHTGELDSTAMTHPLYRLNQANFETASVTEEPVYNILRHFFDAVDQFEVTDEVIVTSPQGDQVSSSALLTDLRRSRFQFLYTADELIDLGLSAGWVGAMRLNVAESEGAEGLLRIRMTTTLDTELSAFQNTGLTEVHASVFSPIQDWNEFLFHTPFEWDGASSIVFELTFVSDEEAGATSFFGTEANSIHVNSFESDRFMAFDGDAFIEVPQEAFDEISDEVTISFWVNGHPGVQPAAQTVFEGVNAANQRVLNSHLPWENGRIYWDAGQSGGYDRIDQQATTNDYAGQWNHYAFTKNATTGVMNIYLNGTLWHTGTDRTRTMEDIVRFHIGASGMFSLYYNGSVDDFNLWNVALDQETIQEWMSREITPDHPNYDDLLVYYTFNEGDGGLVADHSPNAFHGTLIGQASRTLYEAEELFLRFETIGFRPQISLSQGDFTVEQTELFFDEEQLATPSSLITYEVQGNFVVPVNTAYVWVEGEAYGIYDIEGNFIEAIEGQQSFETVTNSTLEYYAPPFEVVDRYELGRFITPYGIGLDLGAEGWTWVFDVTDYEPLLHGMVELEAGNWQELLDLKFVFIEGTPPREVKRVDAFWKGQYNLNNFNEVVTTRTFTPEPGEETFRLKTRASGHGFGQGNNCGEFCYNTHSVKVNGQTQWSWEIMEECADNPLYPQGGTWIYDRAGWCPGAKVTTQDFELTPLVESQSPFDVKYEIVTDPFGNYRMEGQVIAYGPYNFQNDVELEEILAPSNWKIHGRMNPICDQPKIRIKNNGAQNLTSCTITFGVNGEMETYEWSGNLAFAESEVVDLTYTNTEFYLGDEDETLIFSVTVDSPNGEADEYTFNNMGTSAFKRPPVYQYPNLDDNRMIVWIQTNNTPWENTVSIEDLNGDEVFARNYSQPNFAHRDTIQLNEGCYKFHLTDSDHDGLSFFANSDGNGTARLRRVAGSNFIQFNPNFGMEVVHHFYFKTNLVSVKEQNEPSFSVAVFPNPGNEYFTLRISGASSRVQYSIFDLNGRMVRSGEGLGVVQGDRNDIAVPTSDFAPGLYNVVVEENGVRSTLRWLKN